MGKFIAAWLVILTLNCLVWAGIIYVVWHFLAKVW